MKYDTKELDFHIIIPFVFNYLHFRNIPFVTFFCWILHLREPNIINNECYHTNLDFQNDDLGSQSTSAFRIVVKITDLVSARYIYRQLYFGSDLRLRCRHHRVMCDAFDQ